MIELFAKKKNDITGYQLKLVDHIKHVIFLIKLFAEEYLLDKKLAEFGAIFHDLGKVHPEFIFRMNCDKFDYTNAKPLRHEIVSLLFLPAVAKEYWNPIIDLVIGHHKSVRYDNNGLIELVENYCDVFEFHSKNWETWYKDGLFILNEFEINCENITYEQAREAFEYVVLYCENRPLGISKYRGLLVTADHLASCLEWSIYKTKLNIVPDLSKGFKIPNKFYPLSSVVSLEKKHTFIISPTGSGKTDLLLKRHKGRIYYILPFQASINAMYNRIKKQFEVEDIRLLHASSKMFVEKNNYKEIGLQKLPGASIKVCTPYQIFSILFATKGYESLYLDIENCDIIFDEIHVYDNISRELVLKLIELLKHMGCRIHIGTATIETEKKNQILNILGKSDTQVIELSTEELNLYNRHIVYKRKDFIDSLLDINTTLDNQEKLLVVANTVKNAIKYYQQLMALYPALKIMLIHGRFKRKDRKRKEAMIYEFNTFKNVPCIVVSTQIIEVSLDINFDSMVTECPPLPDLIQRMGRVNRERNIHKLNVYKNIYVLEPPLSFKECLPYTKEELWESWRSIESGALFLESEIQNKIDNLNIQYEKNEVTNYIAWNSDTKQYDLPELVHNVNNILEQALNIESSCVIVKSDRQQYLELKDTDRTELEIPISFQTIKNKIVGYEQLSIGNRPYVISDRAYNEEIGLIIELI